MSGKKWVLLVAGSNGWKNYRHQANVCCAYQIIKSHGIPDEQIVVMMYDDIAYNPKNPYKGKIISVINQENVYKGVLKDYTGNQVTPKNFLAALRGDDSAGGKVINSGSNDKIFVYMSGLGEIGKTIFDFPEDQELSESDLINEINTMSNKKQFSKMVIYMDSDNSGSMFKNLSKSINVYAVTSCEEKNKSIPSVYDPNLNVHISDEFSSALLTFINSHDFSSATLKELFAFIANKLSNPPCQFGDTKINECLLSEFLKN